MTVPGAVLDPGRLAAVVGSGLLDTPAEQAFDRLAEMAGRLLGAPFAFVTIVDAERSYWKSCIGVGISGDNTVDRQNTVEESFCQYVVGSGEKLIVGNTRSDPRTRDNPSIEAMGVEAWAGYPVLSPTGEILGSFCVVDTKTREWTAQDESVLETLAEATSREIALRAAINSTHDLARSLQASLLPARLPVVPGMDVSARYTPAGTGTEVWGGFYDAFALGEGRWGFVLGEVCGKGVEAAKVIGLARYTIRGAAIIDPGPDRVLGVLNRVMLGADLPDGLFLSCQFGVLESSVLRLSSAGHPPPLLRRADGGIEEIVIKGTLLGLTDEPDLALREVTLAGGDALVFYTDGVTAPRGTVDVLGESGLRAVLAAAPNGADAIADHIEAAARAHSREPPSDDMVVLVVGPH